MAEIKITIPDNKLTDFIDSMSNIWHYNIYLKHLDEGETPISKGAFVKREIINYLKNLYREAKQVELTTTPQIEDIDIT